MNEVKNAREVVEAGFTRNNSLENAVYECCRRDGQGWFNSWMITRKVGKLSDMQRYMLEHRLTNMAVDDHVKLPTESIVGGVFVGNYLTDLLEWLLENWDRILSMIMDIINLS